MVDITPNSMGYVDDRSGTFPAAYQELHPYNSVKYFHNCSKCSSTCGIKGVYEVMADERSPFPALLQKRISSSKDLQSDGDQAQQCRIMNLPVRGL